MRAGPNSTSQHALAEVQIKVLFSFQTFCHPIVNYGGLKPALVGTLDEKMKEPEHVLKEAPSKIPEKQNGQLRPPKNKDWKHRTDNNS